jgi:Domain of unknown function (DUF2804), N-terminal/Domain of unknown function (DUF2804), C-terminal
MPLPLPEFMPIAADRMRGAEYPLAYDERELSDPVDLCDARGQLNPDAVGWSRAPLVRANLSGHWPRKKRWNFWNWISPRCVFSVTLADIDYVAFCQMTFTDFESGRSIEALAPALPGSIELPEHVERTVRFRGGRVDYASVDEGGDIKVDFAGRAKTGEQVSADFVVRRPAAQESLNVVVPWSRDRFQLNSKHNTLPCEGSIAVDGERYEMNPADCHAVQDFGRGIWPYRSFWNWGVGTGMQDGVRIGINVGGKWTTGTGANENGLCIDGRLYKIMEDLTWRYDASNWMQPWHVRAERSGMVDLTLHPIAAHRPMLNLGLLRSGGVCSFGRWQGTVRFDGGEIRVHDLIGWAEEFSHRW